METARRCVELGTELGIPRSAVIANKFRSADDLAAIRDYAQKYGLEVWGEVPYDENVQEADLRGSALELNNTNAAVAAVDKVVKKLGL